MDCVRHYLTKFDFTASLFMTISRESQTNPPPSANATNGLSDLSDLTELSDQSPEPTPPSLLPFPYASLPDGSQEPIPSMTGCLDSYEFCPKTAVEDRKAGLRGEGSSSAKRKGEQEPLSRLEKIKSRQYMRNREWRKKKRAEKSQGIDSLHIAREGPRKKYIEVAVPIQTELKTDESEVTAGGYTGGDRRGSKKVSTLSDVMTKGFDLIRWDGSTPHVILDKGRRIIGILAGHPPIDEWSNVQVEAADAIKTQSTRLRLTKKMRKNRRGAFTALACGVSHGGGQQRPSNLDHHPTNQTALSWLTKSEPFKRIAGFASSVLAHWAPDLHTYYAQVLDALHSNDETLTRLFPSGIFCAASYNFGPRTTCYKHRDYANLPFGFCAITALGTFDPTKGGHLVLWDLKLAIEFPPGSTILIPSAIIAHSNTPVGKDENRYSFTQYTAGALFRWVDNHCTKQETYLSTLTPEELAMVDANNKARWNFGLSLLPTIAEHVPVVEL